MIEKYFTIFAYLKDKHSYFIEPSNKDTQNKQMTGLNTTVSILNNNKKLGLTDLEVEQNKKRKKKIKKYKNEKNFLRQAIYFADFDVFSSTITSTSLSIDINNLSPSINTDSFLFIITSNIFISIDTTSFLSVGIVGFPSISTDSFLSIDAASLLFVDASNSLFASINHFLSGDASNLLSGNTSLFVGTYSAFLSFGTSNASQFVDANNTSFSINTSSILLAILFCYYF